MTTLVLALALQCFFPLFGAPSPKWAGMSIVNAGDRSQNYVLTSYESQGTPTEIAQLSLEPRAQKAFLLTELFSKPAPSSGWLQVESLSTTCSAFLASAEDGVLMTAEGATALERVLIVPHVEINTGFVELEHTETTIALVNPSTTAAQVSVELFDMKGGVRGSVTKALAANGSQEFRVSQAFSAVLPGNGLGGHKFEGYIRLSSDIGIAAWQRVETPLAGSVLRARSAQTTTGTAYFPHFAFGGGYGSILNLINSGSTSLDLELIAMGDDGKSLGEPVRLALAPGEGRRASIDQLFNIAVIAIYPPPLITGFIRISSVNGAAFQIDGNMELFNVGQGGRQSLMLPPLTETAATSLTVPLATTSGPYFTGFGIVNPNSLLTVQTDVVVDFVSAAGTTLDQAAIQLSPGTRRVKLVTTPDQTGYLRFTSNFPIHVFGSIGTLDHQALEAIPAVR